MQGICQDCGTFRKYLHKHHIVPKSQGGSDAADNLVALCANCHEDRHGGSFHKAVSEKSRNKHGKRLRRMWRDPKFRARMIRVFKTRETTAETRRQRSVRMKAKWQEPEYRGKISIARRKYWASAPPDARKARMKAALASLTHEKRSEHALKFVNSPEARKRRSEYSKAMWADPKRRQAILRAQRRGQKAAMINESARRQKIRDAWTPARRIAQAERMKALRKSQRNVT